MANKNKRAKKANVEPEKSVQKDEAPNIVRITNRLLSDIRSLQFALDEIAESLGDRAKNNIQAFTKFVDGHKSPDNANAEKKYNIPVEKVTELSRLVKDLDTAVRSLPLSVRGLFLVLISKWDAYVASILRWVYHVQPEIINSSGRSISYSDLREIDNMRVAREKIVEEEISAVLRESHTEHFEYIERKLKMSLRTDLDIWPQFVEATQRRHLIAHADGRVSYQYLQVCREQKVDVNVDLRPGAQLSIGPDYFRNTSDCLTELGFKLSQVLWRKLQPQDSAKADEQLIHTTFEMIEAEQFVPAIKILIFSLKPPMKFSAARTRLICLVNLALAYKWSAQEAKCKETIDAEDWSASNMDFQLAVAVLRDDFDLAVKLMKRIGSDGDVKKQNYDDWPLFKEFRKSPKYLSAYRKLFAAETEIEVPQEVRSLLPHKPQKIMQPSKRIVRGLRKAKNASKPAV